MYSFGMSNKVISVSENRPKKIENYYRVSKSNVLIDSVQTFTANELKVVLSVISLINTTNKDEDCFYRVPISSFKEILGSKDNGFYTILKKMTYSIMSKPIWYEDKEKNETIQCNWFSLCRYKNQEGVVEFQINPALKPLLLDLKGNYTSFILENVIKLQSKYSIRIYQLLKKVENLKDVIFWVYEIRELLNITNQYKQYSQFKERVLNTSQKEINKYTDISFTFKEHRTGRKIDRIEFKVRTTKIKENKPDNQEQKELFPDVFLSLIQVGIKDKTARNYIDKYGESYLKEKINIFNFEKTIPEKQQKMDLITEATYLSSMIKNDFKNNLYEVDKLNKKDEEKKKKDKEYKKKIKELKIEYEDYIDSFVKPYNGLELKEKQLVDNYVDTEINKKNKSILVGDMYKLTLLNLRRTYIRDMVKKDLLSYEDWLLER